MLKMMEAFSNANEYCAVALCVNASNLHQRVSEHGNTHSHGEKQLLPGEGDPDMLFVDRKAQIQQFELTVVPV